MHATDQSLSPYSVTLRYCLHLIGQSDKHPILKVMHIYTVWLEILADCENMSFGGIYFGGYNIHNKWLIECARNFTGHDLVSALLG